MATRTDGRPVDLSLRGVIGSAAGSPWGTRIRARRRVDLVLLAIVGVVAGAAAATGATVADTERVTGVWTGAEVGSDGEGRIIEVINYDFGGHRRHGIFRDVPNRAPGSPVTVSSPSAPDQVLVADGLSGSRIRIGDPSRTVTGRHRYTIRYSLEGIAPRRSLAWDAVGTGWPVGISKAEIHVVAPYEFEGARCVQGKSGADERCGVAQPEPGHLVAKVEALGSGEGVTLYASPGRSLGDGPGLPAPPSGAGGDVGSGRMLPGLVAGVIALVGAAWASRLVRRAGREYVPLGNAAVPGADGEARIDAEQLASLAALEFAPPAGLTPAQGGMVLAEAARDEHKVAWLIGAATDGYLELEGSGRDVTLVRLPRHDGPTARLLDVAFAGRQRLSLGSYDPNFARAWGAVGDELAAWRRNSGLWDDAGDRRCTFTRLLGAAVGVGGLGVAGLGGAMANRWSPFWLVLVAVGALIGGAGLAAVVRSWELRVRTPEGSRLWLSVESFRRFLAQARPQHADEAAKQGSLREYTAWAVAVGQIDCWSHAVAASAAASVDPGVVHDTGIARSLPSATSVCCSEPSSGSGGSGGSGGGSGGGGGGGGGGSW